VEPLEPRRLLSGDVVLAADELPDTTGPQLVGMHLVGPNDAVTQVVLTFNEPMDAATAQNTAAYQLLRRIHHDSDSGGLIDNPFDDDDGVDTEFLRVQFASAAYDDATTSVTLTATKPFQADKRFRNFRIAGSNERALKDVSGNLLDGNADGTAGDPAVMIFKAHRGRRLVLRDTDGDRATLRLTGPGRMISLLHRRRRGGPTDPLIFLDRTTADDTTVRGVVRPGQGGDGAVDIEQITGISAANVTFLSDPAFRIGATQP
jgi:hypothetical protein